jgi:carboxylate-amine ligase
MRWVLSAGSSMNVPTSPDSHEAADRYRHRFGASTPLSIGVEEELLLVDEELRLSPSSEEVLERLRGNDGVTAEIFAGQIELKTGICDNAAQAADQLCELRRTVRGAGPELIGAGLHPDDTSGRVELISKPRYRSVSKDLGGLLKTPPCGLHVHVGMPDPETAVRVANRFRHHLPLLQALTANSPFWEGRDSGHASARTSVVRAYPRFEMPREFRDYEDFCKVADQLIAAAGVEDYTFIWWDVRPHPHLGTVEIRAMDVQTDAHTSAAIAALIQAMAAKEIDRPSGFDLYREALEESYFQAARYGMRAKLLVEKAVAAPAVEVARSTIEDVRPYARELSGEDALEEIERVVREGNGADAQRRVHASAGMQGLLRDLLERSRSG